MAKAKKKGDKNLKTSVEITFEGGPKDGKTLIVVDPPPPRLRLALPEWCNYYRKGDSFVYYYDMETPWVTVNSLETSNR